MTNHTAPGEALLVSVFVITYNHEKFIRQTLESILMQKTSFALEIVVGEDGSTDDTRKILLEIAGRHAEKFKLLLHSPNIGAHKNQELTFLACTGKYVAMLEGDDYWTDPLKLQKQVDFMETNPDYAVCFHNMEVVHEDGSQPPRPSNLYLKDTFTAEDLCRGNFIYTASCLYRNPRFRAFPDWFPQAMPGDWPLHIMVAQQGKIRYLDELMGVYRVHAGGSWSLQRRSKSLESVIRTAKYLQGFLGGHQAEILAHTIAGWLLELHGLLVQEGRWDDAAGVADDYFSGGSIKISVVIPVHQQELPLAKRLETVIRQTFPIFEVLLLTDGGTGGDAQTIRAYASRHARIRVVEAEAGCPNLYRQWNRGVTAARGEYVWIAGSNDFAHPELLAQLMVPLLADAGIGLSYCGSWRVDANDAILGSCNESFGAFPDGARWETNYRNKGQAEVMHYLVYRNTIPSASAVVFRRSVYLKAGMAEEGMAAGGDWYVWLKMLLISSVAYVAGYFNYCREPLPEGNAAEAGPPGPVLKVRKLFERHLVRKVARATPFYLEIYQLNKMLRLTGQEAQGYWSIKHGNVFSGFRQLLPVVIYPKPSLYALKVGAHYLKKRLRRTQGNT